MKLSYKLYAIVDVKGKCIVGTFSSVNDSTAERSFMNLLTDPANNIYNSNPDDFALYHVCDMGYNAGSFSVAVPDSEILRENGFTTGLFNSDKVILEGSSFTRERLLELRKQRYLDLTGGVSDGE